MHTGGGAVIGSLVSPEAPGPAARIFFRRMGCFFWIGSNGTSSPGGGGETIQKKHPILRKQIRAFPRGGKQGPSRSCECVYCREVWTVLVPTDTQSRHIFPFIRTAYTPHTKYNYVHTSLSTGMSASSSPPCVVFTMSTYSGRHSFACSTVKNLSVLMEGHKI